jgi:hypothetical protein
MFQIRNFSRRKKLLLAPAYPLIHRRCIGIPRYARMIAVSLAEFDDDLTDGHDDASDALLVVGL